MAPPIPRWGGGVDVGGVIVGRCIVCVHDDTRTASLEYVLDEIVGDA